MCIPVYTHIHYSWRVKRCMFFCIFPTVFRTTELCSEGGLGNDAERSSVSHVTC